MIKKIQKILFLTILIFISADSFAEDIVFDGLFVRDGRMYLSFSVKSYKKSDIVEAVKRGIVLKVRFDIEIFKKSTFEIFGKNVRFTKTIRRSAKYDYSNRAFIIEQAGKKDILFYSEKLLLNHFFSVKDFDLGNVRDIQKKDYSMRVSATLQSVKLYFPMNLIFKYIIGLWDFETGWKVWPDLYNMQ